MMDDRLQIGINRVQFYRNAGTLGMSYLLQALIDSPLFEVEYHDLFHKTHRDYRGTIITCKDYEIYVDFWEYPAPTFMKKTWERNFDLIVELQYINMTLEYFEKYCSRKNLFGFLSSEQKEEFLKKMVPWTFFPSRMMHPYIGNESVLWNKNIEIDGFFCGKFWKGRHPFLRSLEAQGIETIESSRGEDDFNLLTNEQYFAKMQTSKYGIVLSGRTSGLTDRKNRREIDYMMMKKPLLMNYQPCYYDPLVPGKHYIEINQKTQIAAIADLYDIAAIAEEGHQWYKRNATPDGAARLFRRIIYENLHI